MSVVGVMVPAAKVARSSAKHLLALLLFLSIRATAALITVVAVRLLGKCGVARVPRLPVQPREEVLGRLRGRGSRGGGVCRPFFAGRRLAPPPISPRALGPRVLLNSFLPLSVVGRVKGDVWFLATNIRVTCRGMEDVVLTLAQRTKYTAVEIILYTIHTVAVGKASSATCDFQNCLAAGMITHVVIGVVEMATYILTELFHGLLLLEEGGEGREGGRGGVGEVLPGDPRTAGLSRPVPFQSQQHLERRREPVLLLGHYPVQLLSGDRNQQNLIIN